MYQKKAYRLPREDAIRYIDDAIIPRVSRDGVDDNLRKTLIDLYDHSNERGTEVLKILYYASRGGMGRLELYIDRIEAHIKRAVGERTLNKFFERCHIDLGIHIK